MNIGFIGAGKVGVSLGKYFTINKLTVVGYYSEFSKCALEAAEFTNSKAFSSMEDLICVCNVIFITTPDDTIPIIWDKIQHLNLKDKILCHTSGSLSSEVFKNISNCSAYGYSIHPMYAFSDKFNSYKNLKTACFSIEGDFKHLHSLKELFEGFGNKVIVINKDNKALYHLASVTVSNLVLSLINVGCGYLSNCGLNENEALGALMPLIQNNIDNLKLKDFSSALTGPIDRNDLGTVEKHLLVIPEEHEDVYKTLSLNLAKISKEKHINKNYSNLEKLLGGN